MSRRHLHLLAIAGTFFLLTVFGDRIFAWLQFGPSDPSLISPASPVSSATPAGILMLVFPLLCLLLFSEVGLRVLFLQAISPITHIPVDSDRWQLVLQEHLTHYTRQLEQLGFVQLTDYTFSTVAEPEPSPSTARLFVHPEKKIFAEIGQVGNVPMYCSMVSFLEDNWDVAVTNQPATGSLAAISYALLRLPRTLIKKMKGDSLELLFQSVLTWRDQVSSGLEVAILENIDAETYFLRDADRRAQQRRGLMRKSITWGLLEMILFLMFPSFEWLGEYKAAAASSGF